MIISESVDTLLAENLSPVDYKQLSIAMEADATKSDFMNSLLGRIVNSSSRCIEDAPIIKNDVFSSILQTKGDIHKHSLFANTGKPDVAVLFTKSSNKDLAQRANDILKLSNYLTSHKQDFLKGFKDNNPITKVVYVGLVSTVLLGSSQLVINHSKTTKQSGVFDNLHAMVSAIEKGFVDKIIGSQFVITESQDVLKTVKDIFRSVGVGGAVAAAFTAITGSSLVGMSVLGVSALVAFFLSIKLVVFAVYESRIKLSDYIYQQAMFLEMNVSAVKTNNKFSEEEKKEILARQEKMAEMLVKLSEKIAVDGIKSKRAAESADKRDTKEIIEDTKEDNTSDETVIV